MKIPNNFNKTGAWIAGADVKPGGEDTYMFIESLVRLTEEEARIQGFIAVHNVDEWNAARGAGQTSGTQKIALFADLDFQGTDLPINGRNEFSGELYGNGYTIKNAKTLIGKLAAGGKVRDLILKNIQCEGYSTSSRGSFRGILAHHNAGTITNCGIRNCGCTIETGNFGGFVGYDEGTIYVSYVKNCHFQANSTGSNPYIAGFCSYKEKNKIQGCFVENTTVRVISGNDSSLGGFVSCMSSESANNFILLSCVKNCNLFAQQTDGTLLQTLRLGGFISECDPRGDRTTQVYDCYVKDTQFNSSVCKQGFGGFLGIVHYKSPYNFHVIRCYCACDTPALDYKQGRGPFAGWANDDVMQNCLYDAERSLITGSRSTAVGLTTAEMKTQSTYTGKGFNFNTNWAVTPETNVGYPYLINTQLEYN